MAKVLLLSGGVDSLCLLSVLAEDEAPDLCVTFDYGQRHKREIEAAVKIAKHYSVRHAVLQLPQLTGSALTHDQDVPTCIAATAPEQSCVVVPNRNMIMVSVAANYAGPGGIVYLATNSNDHSVFPDCRPRFLDALRMALMFGADVQLHTPFQHMDKKEIIRKGEYRAAPFQYAWSCYLGGDVQCGQCAACLGVKEAMQ